MEQIVKVISTILVGIVLVLFLAVLIALPVEWLWNRTMPEIFGLQKIGFSMALKLSLLASFLSKGSSSSKSKD